MKRNIMLAACVAALAGTLGLVGCGGPAGGDSAGQNLISNAKAGKSDSIGIDDIDFTVEDGFWYDERKPVLTYTNNSDFDVVGIEIEFSQKEDVTDEQRADVFAEFMEDDYYKDDDFTEYVIRSTKEQLVAPGETSLEAAVYINYTGRMLPDAGFYDLFEPNMMQVMYLGGDGKVYLEYIDFKTGKTKDASQGGKDAVMWSDSDLAKRTPKLEAPVRIVTTDDEEDLWFETLGSTIEDFDAYVVQLKDAGYDAVDYEDENEFRAHDKDGYEISATFSEMEGSISVHLDTDDVKAPDDEKSGAESQQVNADFKKSVDEYEEFFCEYVEFMKAYKDADSPTDMAGSYAEYMKQYEETMLAFSELDTTDLSAADAAYLLDAQTRITTMIASI